MPEPAGGPGDKVFPPSHSVGRNEKGAGAKYAFETRRRDENDVFCVLMDSVQSQANRTEEELQAFPVGGVDGGSISMRACGHCDCAPPRKTRKTRGPCCKRRRCLQHGWPCGADSGNDALISAFNPGWKNPNLFDDQVRGTASIIAAVKTAGIKRVLWVGGAGGLEVKLGVRGADNPDLPDWVRRAGGEGAPTPPNTGGSPHKRATPPCASPTSVCKNSKSVHYVPGTKCSPCIGTHRDFSRRLHSTTDTVAGA